MKYLTAKTALAASLLIFSFATTAAADEEIRSIEAMPGTPTIDGEIDDVWSSAVVGTTDKQVDGESSASADQSASAKFRCLWDKENLYVLAEVTDAKLGTTGLNAWERDSVEVFLDRNNAKSSSYDDDDGQYRVSCEGKLTYGPDTDEVMTAAAKKTDAGYIVEAAIKLSSITGEAGAKLGFDLQVNDDGDDSGTRSSIMKWSDDSNETYQDFSSLGNLLLASGSETPAKTE